MIAVLFIPLLLINLAYDILAKIGIYDLSAGIVIFSFFFEVLIIPLTIYKTFSGYKVKNEKKAIIRHNIIMIVISLLLSFIGIYAAATIPDTINAFERMNADQITAACTTFGVDMREKGIALNWTLALPVLYVLVSTVPSKIRKNQKAKKEREEILAGLSEKDKALYLEEEAKINRRSKKITVKKVLINLLPVYSIVVCVIISRQIVFYFLMAAIWREIINAVLRLVLKNKMKEAQERAKQNQQLNIASSETEHFESNDETSNKEEKTQIENVEKEVSLQ